MTILLDNVGVDVTDPTEIFESAGGPAVIHVRANDYGGATVEIQSASGQDTTVRWATLTSGTITADDTVKLDYLPNGMKIRAIVTGTTGPTDGVFVDIVQ